MAGPTGKLEALDIAIEHCEQALADLDAFGLYSEGASLSFALDHLRTLREHAQGGTGPDEAP